jgi:hypothetical protein
VIGAQPCAIAVRQAKADQLHVERHQAFDRVELDRIRAAGRRLCDRLPQLIARVVRLQHAKHAGHQRQQDADSRQDDIDRDAVSPLH